MEDQGKKQSLPSKSAPIVGADVAESEFERWANAMDLYIVPGEMDAEDLTTHKKHSGMLKRAMMLGSLVINESGEAVYTPQKSPDVTTPLVFHERTGASLMAVDGKKDNYNVTKMYSVMADMCRVPPVTFSKLIGIDAKICEVLFAYLMD